MRTIAYINELLLLSLSLQVYSQISLHLITPIMLNIIVEVAVFKIRISSFQQKKIKVTVCALNIA